MVPSICVALNGPPGIGKDTLAKMLADLNTMQGVRVEALAAMIKKRAAGYYGIPDLQKLATERETKDTLMPEWMVTPRDLVIHYSENVVKPMHGKDIWARKFANLLAGEKLAIMTDLGFPEEIRELSKVFDQVLIVQLHEEGFDFSQDSRGYVDAVYPNVSLQIVKTERGHPHTAVQQIAQRVQAVFEQQFR